MTVPPHDILVVINRLDTGGTERHLSQVLPRLDPSNFRPAVQTLRGGGSLETELRRAGIPVAAPNPALPLMLQRLCGAASLLRRLLFQRPAILHLFLPEAYLIGGFAGLAARQRTIVMSRRSLNFYQAKHAFVSRLERWLHRRVAALVANSTAVERQLCEEAGGRDRVHLIRNGIDAPAEITSEQRVESCRRFGIPAGTLVFVIVANLIPYKGHADLLRAFAAVRDRLRVPWRLYCVGRDDGGGERLRQLGHELGIGANVYWEGEQRDVWVYLTIADVGVLASHEEGFSNSILEGMAAALPMIVTDVGGNPEAVADGETGLVVPARDLEAMGAAILRLADDPELRARLGRAGRRRVETEFSLERCAAEYEKLYTDLAAARGAR